MDKFFKTFRVFFVLIFLSASFFAPRNTWAEVQSDDEQSKDETITKGIYQFRQENFDEALATFQGALKAAPDSSLLNYYIGLCYKRMEDYGNARNYLEKSLTLKPKIKGAIIELIDLLYRLDKVDDAKKWIKVAEDEGVRPAQAKFLKGLTLQKSGENDAAIQAFKDAKDLDERLKQPADYQIGVCYLKMKKYDSAKELFQNVFMVDPNSQVGSMANKYIDAIDRKKEKDRPFHGSARFAFEYDSNVLLQPDNSAFITQVSDNDDTREVYDIKGDYTFKTEDQFLSLKTGYGLHVSKQNDLGKYDVVGNNFQAQGNANFERVLVTVPVSYNHSIVDDKNYLSSFTAGNLNNILVTKTQMAVVGALYRYDDYLRPVYLSDESRTGSTVIGTGAWFWFFKENTAFVSARYSFEKDWTDGKNWDYYGSRMGITFLYPIIEKLKFSASGEVFLQNFDNRNTIFDKDRADQVYTVTPLLSYEIIKNLEIQFRYTYVNERSSISLYQYDRHVVSTACEYRF